MTIAAYLGWTRSGRERPSPEPPPHRAPVGPQPGDLDRARSPREPDPLVFGDWHPPPLNGCRSETDD